MKRLTFGCRGKISYATQALAAAAKRAMHNKDRKHPYPVAVFACRECAGFHIGRHRRSGYGSGTPPNRKDSERNRKARYIQLVEEGS